jgi:hypothetical protein
MTPISNPLNFSSKVCVDNIDKPGYIRNCPNCPPGGPGPLFLMFTQPETMPPKGKTESPSSKSKLIRVVLPISSDSAITDIDSYIAFGLIRRICSLFGIRFMRLGFCGNTTGSGAHLGNGRLVIALSSLCTGTPRVILPVDSRLVVHHPQRFIRCLL